MEKIYLSKKDKQTISDILSGKITRGDLPNEAINATLSYLENINFICIKRFYDGTIRNIELSDFGKKYMLENSKLCNKISDTTKWVVSLIITTIIAVTSIIIQVVFRY